MSRAGGVDFPGEVGGIVALTEVVIHGWDVAAATGQDYDVDPATLDAVLPHVTADRGRRSGRGIVRACGDRRRRCADAGPHHRAERPRPGVGVLA